LRRVLHGITAILVYGAMGAVAQTAEPHANTPLNQLFRPHAHASPVPANRQSTAEVVFDATALGSPVLLDKGWRVGITANPAAETPEFDDSGWAIRDAQESFADVPDEGHPASAPDWDEQSGGPQGRQRPFAWFRLHIKLAPHHGPLVLLLELPVSQTTSNGIGSTGPGVEVFANGKQIQPEGPHPDSPEYYQQISRIYDLKLAPSNSSDTSGTSLTLALRTLYVPLGIGAYTSFFGNRTLRLGNRQDLDRSMELWSVHSLFERLPRLVYSILLLVLALFLLALYFSQRGHTEYLWLALYELIQAPIGFVELAGSSARLDQLLAGSLSLQLLLISAYLYFEFLVAFLSLRRRWYIRLLRYSAPLLAGVGPGLLMVGHGSHIINQQVIGIALALVGFASLLWMIGWLLFVFITLIAATLRRNFEAGLLLLPLVLSFGGLIELVLAASMSDWGGHSYRSPLTFQAGPIPIHFASIADFAGIFAIVLIVFVRFLRVQRDQQRASNELAAARSVQELMIPQQMVQTPGFEVDSVYNPANEVGGDFFYVHETGDGGLLVVIGDVAGKGLKAAMNVSMLMGALRSSAERNPARILEGLNRVMAGSESFTTCQAAWFHPSGELVLANAGHLPPYLNSQEILLPGGLPLGVLAEIEYEEVRLYLHPGDRLLLMSDGVVESRQPSGELFGFDRVHNLSSQSAFYIADAAKDFGQEDDITVLTVRRLAEAATA